MPPTVLAGLPGSRAPRPVLVTSAAPAPRPSCLTSWACVHTHPTPPPVAVGALNKHRRGEERPVSSLCSHTTHNRPPCGSSTRHAPPCCPKHFLFQESTSQTIPWTTGVVLTHQPHRELEVGERPSARVEAGGHSEAGTGRPCCSPGRIQVLALSPLLRRGLAWWWVLAAQPAQDHVDVLAFPV